MNVKIAMLIAPSEYERLTLDAASSFPIECLLDSVLSGSRDPAAALAADAITRGSDVSGV
jgi:hypothetical protein